MFGVRGAGHGNRLDCTGATSLVQTVLIESGHKRPRRHRTADTAWHFRAMLLESEAVIFVDVWIRVLLLFSPWLSRGAGRIQFLIAWVSEESVVKREVCLLGRH